MRLSCGWGSTSIGLWHGLLDLLIAFLFVLAGAGMTWNEYKKKRRRHLDEVNPHKLP